MAEQQPVGDHGGSGRDVRGWRAGADADGQQVIVVPVMQVEVRVVAVGGGGVPTQRGVIGEMPISYRPVTSAQPAQRGRECASWYNLTSRL